MDIGTLRDERTRLCAQINTLDLEIRQAARERGALWRRLYTRRMLMWRRLNTVERQMVQHFVEGSAPSFG
jgi:hypothetical protein